MAVRKRRHFTAEQKADAVELVRRVGSVPQVAKDLGLIQSVLYEWVKAAEDKGDSEEPLTTPEREELLRLRREVAKLRMERDFLKKAAAFFAKDDDRPSS